MFLHTLSMILTVHTHPHTPFPMLFEAPAPQTVLAELELETAALAAHGLTTEAQQLAAALPFTSLQIASIQALRAQLSDAMGELVEAETALRLNLTNEELRTVVMQAADTVTELDENLATSRASLAEALLGEWEPASLQRIESWRESEGFMVPPEFRVLERSRDEWHDIARAIIAERRAIRLGHTLEEPLDQLLADIRSNADVIQAANNVTAHLPAIEHWFWSEGQADE